MFFSSLFRGEHDSCIKNIAVKSFCSACLGLFILAFGSCASPLDNPLSSGSSQKNTGILQIGTQAADDVFVMTSLNQLIPGFDYNLYSDSACNDKVLYSSASYFLYVGNDKFYFSNKYSYDSKNQILYIETVKNAQFNKDGNAFLFSESNGSKLVTLKITGISSAMTSGNLAVYENAFSSTDYQAAWNQKSAQYNQAGTLYYKLKQDFTSLQQLPQILKGKKFFLTQNTSGESEYVKIHDNKFYSLAFEDYNILRQNHSQNLYQITSDSQWYYFGFASTSRESYNNALLDNYLNMPAICRVKFDTANNKIWISESLYLSSAEPSLESAAWTDHEYLMTETEPPAPESSLPQAAEKSLDEMKTLAQSLTSTGYFKNVANPDVNKADFYLGFWFGTASDKTTPAEFFKYVRLKGMKKGKNSYMPDSTSQPADDLYTDEIYTDGQSFVVFGHVYNMNNGAVYPKGNIGKYAVWIISSEGIKISGLYDSLEECKAASHSFTQYLWKQ